MKISNSVYDSLNLKFYSRWSLQLLFTFEIIFDKLIFILGLLRL